MQSNLWAELWVLVSFTTNARPFTRMTVLFSIRHILHSMVRRAVYSAGEQGSTVIINQSSDGDIVQIHTSSTERQNGDRRVGTFCHNPQVREITKRCGQSGARRGREYEGNETKVGQSCVCRFWKGE